MKATRYLVLVVLAASTLALAYWLGTRNALEPTQADTATRTKEGRKLLYYRNPMGLPDTSPVPKKDPMGMDYIPVYEGEESSAGPTADGVVALTPEKIQKLGVTIAAVERVAIARTVRAVGRVEVDERRQYTVAPKFEGWIERLHVSITGQKVARGDPLFEVYSPELISAQREYALAAHGLHATEGADQETHASMRRLADAALTRLRNWDIGETEIARIESGREPPRTLVIRSPATGVVLEKNAVQGMRFGAGDVLYRIADISKVWLIANVFEQDLALVAVGQTAKVYVDAYPGRGFSGRVSYIYPTLDPQTRTARLRIELDNRDGALKPAMYAKTEIDAARAGAGKVLAIPTGAVLQTGTRDLVLVERGEGRFAPREVRLGTRTETLVEVREGLKEGERVVTSANFLIDAESNLRAALAAMSSPASATPTAAAAPASPTAQGAAPTHHATGRIDSIDAPAGEITIAHEAIASLKWPAMTMPFAVKDKSMLAQLKPGQRVDFDLAASGPGEYAIVRIAPAVDASSAQHKGH